MMAGAQQQQQMQQQQRQFSGKRLYPQHQHQQHKCDHSNECKCGNHSQHRAFHATSETRMPPGPQEKDPYKVMGLDKGASKEDVKKRFKELAKKYHPDVCKEPDAKEKFAQLNNAYQILSDDNKRAIFDQTGSAEAAQGEYTGGDPFGGAGGFPGGAGGFRNAEDIFNQFFGMGGQFGGPFSSAFGGGFPGGAGDEESPFGRARSNQPERGENIRKQTTITLKEAVLGSKREFLLDKATPCTTCNGKGKNPKTKPQRCTTCDGTGRVQIRQAIFVMETGCQQCGGTGKIQEDCPSCKGSGYTIEKKKYELTIPRGADDGSMLRMSGLGKPGYNGGPPGDLIMEIKVLPDPVYKRNGLDLEMDAEVALQHAVLGGQITVPLIDGSSATITIPKGSQYGEKITVKGKGIKNRNETQVGDLIVHLKIKLPRNLSGEQEKLFEAFAKSESKDNYKDSKHHWWSAWPFGS